MQQDIHELPNAPLPGVQASNSDHQSIMNGNGDGNFVDSSRTITINLIFTGRVPRGFRRLLREVLEEADSALVAGKPPVYAHARKSKPRDRQPG